MIIQKLKNIQKIKSQSKNWKRILPHFYYTKNHFKQSGGKVGILTAGTSDIGVAEESRLMCEAMNCKCIISYDVGVAGIQRIFPELKKMIDEEVGLYHSCCWNGRSISTL